MAAHLVFRLKRLDAMREASAQLMGRDLLGRDFFVHGMPEGIRIIFVVLSVHIWHLSPCTNKWLHCLD